MKHAGQNEQIQLLAERAAAEKRLQEAVSAHKAAAIELVNAEKALFESRKALVMSGFAPKFTYKAQKEHWRRGEDNILINAIDGQPSLHFVTAQALIDAMYQEGLIKYFEQLGTLCGNTKKKMVPVLEFWEASLNESQRVAILSKIWAYKGWKSEEAEHECEMAKYTVSKLSRA